MVYIPVQQSPLTAQRAFLMKLQALGYSLLICDTTDLARIPEAAPE